MVDTLYYLKKGGRITPAAAALGTLLKLKPVLQIQGEKLDAFAKARTVKQAKNIMIEAMKNDFTKRFNDRPESIFILKWLTHTIRKQQMCLRQRYRRHFLEWRFIWTRFL